MYLYGNNQASISHSVSCTSVVILTNIGGHCSGLGAAFNPKAQFVCCRENPELHPPKVVVPPESTDHEIVIEAATTSSTKGIILSL